MEHRRLGASGLDVSVLALGSWRTYERIPHEQGLEVMRAARELGIDFLDDARYDDESGTAPIRTGYSEVVFGELFRAAGWRRDEVAVANKLWFEFWPEQSLAQELDASLGRMGLDNVDLIYATWPPDGLGAEEIVDGVSGLIAAGKARVWGVVNWQPAFLQEATRIATARGAPVPCCAQLPYSLVSRSWVEGREEAAALSEAGAAVVASAVLASGALSGKYAEPGAVGRLAGNLAEPSVQQALALGPALKELSTRYGTTPAALAIAFALGGERIASVLFGATTADQVRENARALDVPADALAELRGLATG
jgi:aryl-alcohol dehydrogenase-like predicted oxidoreductase